MVNTQKFAPHIDMLVETHAANGGEPVATRLQQVKMLRAETERSLDRINGDPRLTPAGKADAKSRVATKTLADLEAWYAPLARGLAEHKATILNELRSLAESPLPKDSGELVREAIVGSEIRQLAAQLSDAGAALLFQTGGPVVRRALTTMPRISVTKIGLAQVRPWVSEEVVQQTLLEEAKAKRPEAVATLDKIAAAEGAYKACHGALKNALQGLVSVAAVERLAARGVGGDGGIDTGVDPAGTPRV
jgi:hypothetical protein